MNRKPTLLFIAPWLPKLSETFVYKEVLGLRAAGLTVATASVHAPGSAWSRPELRAMAETALPVYGPGALALLGAALREAARHPAAALDTLTLVARDAVSARDIKPAGRLKVLWQGLAGLALAARLRGQEPDHIHAHMAHVSTTIAMYAARQIGCGFSFSGHAADLFRDRALLAEKLGRADFVRCISVWHRLFYQAIVPRPDADYPVVRCGVAMTAPRREARRPPGNPPLLLGVGRLVPKKGFDLLLRAVARVIADGQPCRCRIIGDGPELPRLEALTRELGLEDCVELAGSRDNAEILDTLPQADLFVLPCRTDASGDKDGIPVVLMEAMAAGVCALSGDLETIRELIVDGENGMLAPPDDAAGLASRIAMLLSDDAMRVRLADAGQRQVAREFELDLNVRRMGEAFARCSGQPRRQR